MWTQPHSNRDESDLDRLILDFEAAWRTGPPSIEGFIARASPGIRSAALPELVKVDLQARHRLGERPTARSYLDRFPTLAGVDGPALSLIYDEYCLLAETGEPPSPSDFCGRYPTWGDSLASQLAYHRDLSRAVEPPPTAPDFPEEGDQFGEFDLNATLGQGGTARVFRARDRRLGGKEVALKVSLDRGHEPEILGKLDHPNIVPVHSSVVDPATGFRGLSMPYRPGRSLDRVIRRLGERGGRLPRHARWLREEVEGEGEGAGVGVGPRRGVDDRPGWAGFPERGSHADAVAWLGLRIASALDHAHGRGFFHRDVKPDNVLLADRDGPQLIDFNLAHDPSHADEAVAAQRGGTLPYMAREHLEAFLEPGRWGRVGAAADVFSLGLILRELLTGQVSWRPPASLSLPRSINALALHRAAPPAPIRRANPDVPHGLAAIVDRCTAEAPADRYPDALSLADDLGRFLDRRPLNVARNPSHLEPVLNLARRNRARLATAVALVVVSTVLVGAWLGRVREIPATKQTIAHIENLASTEQGETIQRAMDLILTKPDALPSLRLVVGHYPRSLLIHAAFGTALFRANQIDEAAREFEVALALDPTNPVVVWGLVEIDWIRGHHAAAPARIEAAIAARLKRGVGPHDPILSILREALIKARTHAGDAANVAQEPAQALEHLGRADAALDEDKRPEDPPSGIAKHLRYAASIANVRIAALGRLGRLDEAIDAHRKALADLDLALTLDEKEWNSILDIRRKCDQSLRVALASAPPARR